MGKVQAFEPGAGICPNGKTAAWQQRRHQLEFTGDHVGVVIALTELVYDDMPEEHYEAAHHHSTGMIIGVVPVTSEEL